MTAAPSTAGLPLLGAGLYKRVYALPCGKRVLKVSGGRTHLVSGGCPIGREVHIYEEVIASFPSNHKMRRRLAKIYDHGPGWCIQERVYETHKDRQDRRGTRGYEYSRKFRDCHPAVDGVLTEIQEAADVTLFDIHSENFGYRSPSARVPVIFDLDRWGR